MQAFGRRSKEDVGPVELSLLPRTAYLKSISWAIVTSRRVDGFVRAVSWVRNRPFRLFLVIGMNQIDHK